MEGQQQPLDYSGHVPGFGDTVPKPTKADQHVSSAVHYTREQKGHSLILHLLFGGFVLWIPTIYFASSPRHYFHA